MRQAVRTLGLEIRAGLHAGECELVGDAVGGITVHIGARVMAKAGADEVLVSSSVKDLAVGSGIKFKSRGSHKLKGVPEEWRLYRVL
jgi:class 3 adenylate cyclase